MKCLNCGKEFFDSEQVICEYCGTDLINSIPQPQISGKSKMVQFFEDSGIKDAYKKIKESIKKLKK
ncbi:MAG: hypothetical protein ACFFKA_02465 [Candidatus Thorarchaeota archaeon]